MANNKPRVWMDAIRTRLSAWWTPPSPSKTASAHATGGPITVAAGAVVAVGSEAGSGRLLAASRRPAKGGRRARTGERETEIAAEILS